MMAEKVHRDRELAEALRRVREQVRDQAAGQSDYETLRQVEDDLLYGNRDQVLLPDLRASLEEVNRLWQVREQPFVSHIPLLGRLISFFRERWNRISTKWYVLPILQQQVSFNSVTARALNNLYQYLAVSTLGLVRRMDAFAQALGEAQVALESRVHDEQHQSTLGLQHLGVVQSQMAEGQRQLAEGQRQLGEGQRQLGEGQRQLGEGQRQLAGDLQRIAQLTAELHQGLNDQARISAALRQREEDNRRGYALQRIWLERLMLRLAARPEGPVPQEPVAPLEMIEPLSDHDYFAFENAFRGSTEEIRARQEGYLAFFLERGPVVDIGCGRGEFLELLGEHGVACYGIEINEQMLLVCQENGLDVRHEDAFVHLASLPNGSLGGIFASHVLEHLPTARLSEFARLVWQKLQQGAYFVAETPNPTCLWTFARQFYLDLSHTRPLHPLALQFLMEMAGFREVEVRYVNRVPPQEQLAELPLWGEGEEREAAQRIQQNMARLNDLIYGYQDFAITARK
jgi:2-polyprenyl-3-methyl-5-hydroxy-6-metoxy-1,4-benzoquinol methylase